MAMLLFLVWQGGIDDEQVHAVLLAEQEQAAAAVIRWGAGVCSMQVPAFAMSAHS